MGNRSNSLFFFLLFLFSGCIADVTEQSTERIAAASGKGLQTVFFDASTFRQAFSATGSAKDTLIADGIFSLWSSGSSNAASLAGDVTMLWSVDTSHHGELVVNATGPQAELLSIDKMSATIPAKTHLFVNTTSNDVTVQNMTGDITLSGTGSNISFATAGRMSVQTSTGNITGSSGLGGRAVTTSGNIDITISSNNFESAIIEDDSTGNVNLHIAGGAPITFLLATKGGNIVLNYDGISKNSTSAIQQMAHGGGKNVTVTTGRGNINVSN